MGRRRHGRTIAGDRRQAPGFCSCLELHLSGVFASCTRGCNHQQQGLYELRRDRPVGLARFNDLSAGIDSGFNRPNVAAGHGYSGARLRQRTRAVPSEHTLQFNACANRAAQFNACANRAAQFNACANRAAQFNACANRAAQFNACANRAAQFNACANRAAGSNYRASFTTLSPPRNLKTLRLRLSVVALPGKLEASKREISMTIQPISMRHTWLTS